MKKIILSVRNLRKSFFNRVVIDNLSFDVFEAELVSVLGPSGCGKSTLIRLINGLERCDDKNNSIVEFRGKRIENFSPNERVGINTVFQGYALFPHLNVFENVAYGLRASKRYSGQEAILRKKVMQALKMVRLKNYQERSIESLSGGEGQRVALARALINQPGLLLLDEPFSALDPRLKEKMVIEIRELKSKVKTAFLFVTHDHSEALSLSDRVILLNDGKIQQIASPTLIYDEPVSPWAARFVGRSNVINDAVFVRNNLVRIDSHEFYCLDKKLGAFEVPVSVVIRPEDIFLSRFNQNKEGEKKKNNWFSGEVRRCTFKGIHWQIEVECKNRKFIVETIQFFRVGTSVLLKWKIDAIHVMWKG